MLYRSKSFRLCHRSIMAAHLKTQSLDETTNSDSYCMKRNESSLLNTLQSTETPLFKQPKKQRCIHKPDHPQTKTEICSRVNFGGGSPFGIVSLHKLKIQPVANTKRRESTVNASLTKPSHLADVMCLPGKMYI